MNEPLLGAHVPTAAGLAKAPPRGREIGAEAIQIFTRLNDAKQPLGSRLDRHERIGKGYLGRATFGRLVRDRRFRGVPMILETPAGMRGWGKEIRLLRALAQTGSVTIW